MVNLILKKDFCKCVAAFWYISTIFFTCILIFNPEFTFYPISVAKASTNVNKVRQSHESAVNELFSQALLKNKSDAPRMEFFDEEGKAHLLKEFKRNFVILYFWASWSSDCINELDKLNELKKEMEYQDIYDLIIIPISIDFKSPVQLRSYLDKHGIDKLMIYTDYNKEMMNELGFHSIPQSFLIDKSGKVIASFNQSIDWVDSVVINNILELKGPTDDLVVPAVINMNEASQNIPAKPNQKEDQVKITQDTQENNNTQNVSPNEIQDEKQGDNIEPQDIIPQDVKPVEPKKKKITFIR